MKHIRSTEIEVLETPGGNHTSALATPSRGATQVSIIRQRQQSGGQNPLHYHDCEEVMLLQSGSVRVSANEDTAELCAGDLLIIPAHAVHQITNTGDTPAEWLIISPAGVRFFGANGEETIPAWAK